MQVKILDTPNPHAKRFVLDMPLLAGDEPGWDFPDAQSARHFPFVRALFSQSVVKSVFLGKDFITIQFYTPDHESVVNAGQAIGDLLGAGVPLRDPESPPAHDLRGGAHQTMHNDPAAAYEGEDKEIVEQILELIDRHVRPAVGRDGGDVVFRNWDSKSRTVYLSMHGACAGCPAAVHTMKGGVENLLRHFVPEINAVEAAPYE